MPGSSGATTIRELIARRDARAARRRDEPPGPGCCGFCGAGKATHRESRVPRIMRLKTACGSCPRLPGAHEDVAACEACHVHKKGRGLYELFRLRFPFDRRFADRIPSGLERRYLSAISQCHDCARTLDQSDIDGDGRLTVFDIDFVLHQR
jgi:hypothetical protein